LKPNNIDWIHTFTGKKFRPLAPDPDLIDVRDIARGLSTQGRFGGHTRTYYSVAEHSVRVSLITPAKDSLWGLLHDASEAYLKDMASPIKYAPGLEFYLEAEARLMAAVAVRFGLPAVEPHSVKRADAILLHTEARDLFPSGSHVEWLDEGMAQPRRINPLEWRAAEQWFLERFRTLDKRAKAAA
jgi:uncharacterized protein